MLELLGVGVPRATTGGGWDLWLPFYIVLALILLRVVARFPVNVWTGIAAFIGGTLFAWSVSRFGVVQATGAAFFIALAARAIGRRVPRPQPGTD